MDPRAYLLVCAVLVFAAANVSAQTCGLTCSIAAQCAIGGSTCTSCVSGSCQSAPLPPCNMSCSISAQCAISGSTCTMCISNLCQSSCNAVRKLFFHVILFIAPILYTQFTPAQALTRAYLPHVCYTWSKYNNRYVPPRRSAAAHCADSAIRPRCAARPTAAALRAAPTATAARRPRARRARITSARHRLRRRRNSRVPPCLALPWARARWSR